MRRFALFCPEGISIVRFFVILRPIRGALATLCLLGSLAAVQAADGTTLRPQVEALPESDTAERLKKTALLWALDDADDATSNGLDALAQDTWDDVEALLPQDIGHATSATADLFAPIPQFDTNFIAQDAVARIQPIRESDETWPRAQALSGEYTFVQETRRLARGLLHPQSPYSGDTQALRNLLRRMQKMYDTILDPGYSAEFDPAPAQAEVYMLFEARYPDLILPSRQTLWKSAIAQNAADIEAEHGARFRAEEYGTGWANADVRWMNALLFSYRVLGTDLYRQTAESALVTVGNALYPDGGYAYVDQVNETFTYHSYNITEIARYAQVASSTLARSLVEKSWWYYPLSIEPQGTAEYSTAASWKQYWNKSYGSEAAYVVASLTGSGENYRIATMNAFQGDLFLASYYRDDLTATPSPDNYILHDRNIMGPRGRFGRFSFSGTASPYTGEVRGKMTFVGCMALDEGSGWRLNAALGNATCQVRVKPGYSDIAMSDAEKWDPYHIFLSRNERNATTVNAGFAALTTSYQLGRYKGPLYDWAATQGWLFTPDRLVGIVTLEALATEERYGMNGMLKLVSGRAWWGDRKTFVELGDDTWQYGDLIVKMHSHTYYDAVLDYCNTYSGDTDKCGRIVLRDRESALANEESPVAYPAGTRHTYVVEVRPQWADAADALTTVTAPAGFSALELREGSMRYRLVHNQTATTATYAATLPWLGAVLLHRCGEQHRPDWLNAYASPETDFRLRRFTHTDPVALPGKEVDVAVPPYGHIVLRTGALPASAAPAWALIGLSTGLASERATRPSRQF